MGGRSGMAVVPAVLALLASCGLVARDTVPAVSGAFGSRPVISIPRATPDSAPRMTVLSLGRGRTTVPGDVVLADVEIRRWSDGLPYLSTYDAGQPVGVDLGSASRLWREALVGRPAGSRVMLVGPASQVSGSAGAEIVVAVFDVLGGYPPDARLVGQDLTDLPGELAAPVTTLIGGSGPVVTRGCRIVVQYAVISGHAVDRPRGPTAVVLAPGAVPPGWVDALAGQRVGSRVAVRTPGAGYLIDVIDRL
ncbi:hypothetical protein ACIBHX_31425 [Nonomuraea sp. NPDC050536]|uniref:hypothetical protein n=1 Tax=Nonomuraea sp. NPDC050536 TaxID=3364366 RepID=UPI0037C7286A